MVIETFARCVANLASCGPLFASTFGFDRYSYYWQEFVVGGYEAEEGLFLHVEVSNYCAMSVPIPEYRAACFPAHDVVNVTPNPKSSSGSFMPFGRSCVLVIFVKQKARRRIKTVNIRDSRAPLKRTLVPRQARAVSGIILHTRRQNAFHVNGMAHCVEPLGLRCFAMPEKYDRSY